MGDKNLSKPQAGDQATRALKIWIAPKVIMNEFSSTALMKKSGNDGRAGRGNTTSTPS
jgi:hypothetical protein